MLLLGVLVAPLALVGKVQADAAEGNSDLGDGKFCIVVTRNIRAAFHCPVKFL